MLFFKYLSFSLLLAGFYLNTSAQFLKDCESLNATYKVNDDVNDKFEIVVSAEGAVNSLEYLFYTTEGRILNSDLTKNSIRQIGKGKYFCIIKEKGNCSKTIEIEIQ